MNMNTNKINPIELIQGSEEWKQFRCGKITSSRFRDVMSKGKGSEPSRTRLSYLYEIAAEIITGKVADNYISPAMEHGTLCEPLARIEYEEREALPVQQVGIIEHPKYNNITSSPDGFIGENGLLEIKCPKTSTQIQYVLDGVFPSEYQAQVQGQLWICEREWCDFVSFDPRIEGPSQYFKIRVNRDEEYIEKLKNGVDLFITDLNKILERLGYEK